MWGEEGGFLLVVYSEGASRPTFWECRMEWRGEGEWELCCGETTLQVSHVCWGTSNLASSPGPTLVGQQGTRGERGGR